MKRTLLVLFLAGCTMFAQAPAPGAPPAPAVDPIEAYLADLSLELIADSMPAPPVDQIKAYLALTDAQIQALEAIRTAESDQLATYSEQIQRKQMALQQALQQGSNAATVGQLLLDIEALRKQMDGPRTQFHSQAVNTLTAEQKSKLKILEDAAKLLPAIEQAIGLYLLTPPEGAAGPGPGPAGWPGMGPAAFGLRRDAPR